MAQFWRLCCVIVVIVAKTTLTDAQIPGYPLVNVSGTTASIAANTLKVYTTTVRLTRNFDTVNFNSDAFSDSIGAFYTNNLPGFLRASSISSTVNGEKVDVTYNVEARYSILNTSTDASITNGIANYNEIVRNLLSDPFSSFYIVLLADENAFKFAGQSLCNTPGAVTCPTPNTQCDETVNGVAITCVSPCTKEFCKNNGTCSQPSTANPPTCTCMSQSDLWFLGAQCEAFVALWMVIIAAVGAFLLLVGAIIIACCCYSAKRRKKEKEAQYFHDPKDLPAFNNKAYIHDEKELPKYQPREPVYQERSIDAAALAAAKRRSRSSSRDRRRRHRSRSPASRRHRSRTPESRRRRSDRHDRRSRRSDRNPTSNSAVSSFVSSSDSFESSDEETAPPTEPRRPSSTSSDDVTDSASSSNEGDDVAVVAKSQGTSPIRWNTPSEASTLPRRDIAARKGWMPSLGPQMFNLPRADSVDLDESLPEGGRPSPYIADTDI